MKIVKDTFSGRDALSLALELTPALLKQEAQWWCMTDGTMGKNITYNGTLNGMCIWTLPCGSNYRLRSKPTPLRREENEQIDSLSRWWHAGQWELMVAEHRRMKGQAFV